MTKKINNEESKNIRAKKNSIEGIYKKIQSLNEEIKKIINDKRILISKNQKLKEMKTKLFIEFGGDLIDIDNCNTTKIRSMGNEIVDNDNRIKEFEMSLWGSKNGIIRERDSLMNHYRMLKYDADDEYEEFHSEFINELNNNLLNNIQVILEANKIPRITDEDIMCDLKMEVLKKSNSADMLEEIELGGSKTSIEEKCIYKTLFDKKIINVDIYEKYQHDSNTGDFDDDSKLKLKDEKQFSNNNSDPIEEEIKQSLLPIIEKLEKIGPRSKGIKLFLKENLRKILEEYKDENAVSYCLMQRKDFVELYIYPHFKNKHYKNYLVFYQKIFIE